MHICSLDETDFEKIVLCSWSDPEDFLIECAAGKVGADAIITGNGKDFCKSSHRVFNCTELFDWLEDEKGLSFALEDLTDGS